MSIRTVLCLATILGAQLLASPARAHFLWLVRGADAGQPRLNLYFGELAEPDDPDLLDRVASATAWQLRQGHAARQLGFTKASDALTAPLGEDSSSSLFVLAHDLGVIERGGEAFLLKYYAKTGPALGDPAWEKIECGKHLALDLVPRRDGNRLQLSVLWQGQPVAGAEVKAQGPGVDEFEATTDDRGQAALVLGKPGTYSIRARYLEPQGGQSNDRSYASTRHYVTLALQVNENSTDKPASEAPDSSKTAKAADSLPAIPRMVTSFGAAVLDGSLYIYGGHTGRAHSYSDQTQARTLHRLNLAQPKAWESLGDGPGLQGLALVAHGGRLYRIGGFMARNKEGQEHDLWSQAEVASYDPASGKWTDVSPLPEPRSSFDAAVLDGKIYVVGGWQLAGEAESKWHSTAYVLDLAAGAPSWQPLPAPPFERRALAVAAHEGRIYAIGGMQREGGPTTRVAIFDPASGKWSEGPAIQGEPMDGFGPSAFATGGRLYVSTYGGSLQRLAEDGQSWTVVRKLDRARFFHRMLPLSERQLLSVGGASMTEGKFAPLDVLEVGP